MEYPDKVTYTGLIILVAGAITMFVNPKVGVCIIGIGFITLVIGGILTVWNY